MQCFKCGGPATVSSSSPESRSGCVQLHPSLFLLVVLSAGAHQPPLSSPPTVDREHKHFLTDKLNWIAAILTHLGHCCIGGAQEWSDLLNI